MTKILGTSILGYRGEKGEASKETAVGYTVQKTKSNKVSLKRFYIDWIHFWQTCTLNKLYFVSEIKSLHATTHYFRQQLLNISMPGVLRTDKIKTNFKNPYLQIIQSKEEKLPKIGKLQLKLSEYYKCDIYQVLYSRTSTKTTTPTFAGGRCKEGGYVCKCKNGSLSSPLVLFFFS